MSRPLRIEYPDAWYHVMNRGGARQTVFSDPADYLDFIDLIRESTLMWGVRIAAYCLLPNHYHLLIQTPNANVSRCMRHIDGVYTQRHNRRKATDGPLFRGRYKSILVDADAYLLELVRYIHRNPVRAGLVKRLDEYRYSSHGGYMSGSSNWNWLSKEFVLAQFSGGALGGRREYAKFVMKDDSERIERFYTGSNAGPVLGGDEFLTRIRGRFSREKVHREVPESRFLLPGIEEIKAAVCAAYRVGGETLLVSRRGVLNEPRNVAIFLARKLSGRKLDEIADEFRMETYSAAASVVKKMKRDIKNSPSLRSTIGPIESLLTKTQNKT
jgi:putative transposase